MFNFNSHRENYAIITDGGEYFSYKQLEFLQKEFSHYISTRSLIILLTERNLASLIAYVSCIENGIIPIMLDEKINDKVLNEIIIKFRPNYIWVDKNRSDFIHNKKVVYTCYGYVLLCLNCAKLKTDDDLGLLLCTSGSMGVPKFVKISYQNIISNINSIVKYLNITEDDRAITSLPFCYSYGLSIINTHLYSGATILLTNRSIIDKKFWEFFNFCNGTSFSGVPFSYHMLEKVNFINCNINTLKTLTQAGGHLDVKVQKKFNDYAYASNKRFFVMYGQTEATARISYVPYDMLKEKYGSIGIPVPDGTMRLIDEQGLMIKKPFCVGEIIYEGKNVSMGYAREYSDLFSGDKNKGILNTGDLAYFDEDGYYFLVGRKDRIRKLLGIRINLDDIEKELYNIYNKEFACIIYNDKLYIVCENNIDENKVIKYISKKMNLNKSVFMFLIIRLPRKENGKINYQQLLNDINI